MPPRRIGEFYTDILSTAWAEIYPSFWTKGSNKGMLCSIIYRDKNYLCICFTSIPCCTPQPLTCCISQPAWLQWSRFCQPLRYAPLGSLSMYWTMSLACTKKSSVLSHHTQLKKEMCLMIMRAKQKMSYTAEQSFGKPRPKTWRCSHKMAGELGNSNRLYQAYFFKLCCYKIQNVKQICKVKKFQWAKVIFSEFL